jgi:hypothetical protein
LTIENILNSEIPKIKKIGEFYVSYHPCIAFFPLKENIPRFHSNSGNAIFRAFPRLLYFPIIRPPNGVRESEEGERDQRTR